MEARIERSDSTLDGNIEISDVLINVPWGHLKGYSWGDPQGLKVLALHGWLDNSGTFFKLIPFLAKNIYIIAIDFSGHGQSSHRPLGSNGHFEEYLVDVQLVLEALEWEKFVFMGHSLGCQVASWYAGAFPDRVMGIVAIDAFGKYVYTTNQIIRQLKASLTDQYGWIVDKVYPTFESTVERLQNSYAQQDAGFTLEAARALCERGVVKVKGGYQFSADNRLKRKYMLYTEDAINLSILKSVTCSVLLILFKQSYLNRDRSVTLVPREKIKIVEFDGGHHAHLYAPDIIAPFINSFLVQHSKL